MRSIHPSPLRVLVDTLDVSTRYVQRIDVKFDASAEAQDIDDCSNFSPRSIIVRNDSRPTIYIPSD
jgi:hypothetical protein